MWIGSVGRLTVTCGTFCIRDKCLHCRRCVAPVIWLCNLSETTAKKLLLSLAVRWAGAPCAGYTNPSHALGATMYRCLPQMAGSLHLFRWMRFHNCQSITIRFSGLPTERFSGHPPSPLVRPLTISGAHFAFFRHCSDRWLHCQANRSHQSRTFHHNESLFFCAPCKKRIPSKNAQ